jgi:hypothetical protein
MRSLRLLALVAPVLFLPLACEDSSGSSSGVTFNPDAGGFEAGPSPMPEAGPLPEAGVDSSPPAPLGVTVTVTANALPKVNARVVLHDAAGLVIGEKVTDAAGKVTLPTAPSMVTVLITDGISSVTPVTFAGVADGDKLVVAAVPGVAVDPTIVGQYSVSFSAAGVAATADTFGVAAGAGCPPGSGAVGEPAILDLYASCLNAKNAVLSDATSDGSLVGFGFVKDLAKPAAPPPAAATNVGPLAFTAPGTTTLSATNVPPTSTNVSADLFAIANSGTFRMNYSSGLVEAGGQAFKTPTGFAEAYQTVVSFDEFNATSMSTRVFVRRESVPASNVLTAVDYTAALPRITDVPMTTPTAGRPQVVVTSAAALGSADGGVATFSWSNSLAEINGSWTVVFPPSTTTVKLPALPADAAMFVPTPNVSIDEVIFIEATQVPGYKELKLLPIQPSFGVDLVNTQKPLPVPGTVRVSRWTPGVPG